MIARTLSSPFRLIPGKLAVCFPLSNSLGTIAATDSTTHTALQRSQTNRFSSASSVMQVADEEKHITALILGKPGGGKGTICGKILRDFPDFYHISTGEILRQHVRMGTKLGKEAKEHMDVGGLVPDDLIVRLVLDEAHGRANRSILLDGFPRTLHQATALDKRMNVDIVINLDIPDEIIVGRISDRWIHPPSGRVYSYSYKPPKRDGIDDLTGEALTRREDDTPEKVMKRLDAYDKITAPLVEYYEKQGVLETFRGTMSDVIYPHVKEYMMARVKVAA